MDIFELCKLLGVPEEVVDEIAVIDRTYSHEGAAVIWNKFYDASTWKEGIKELRDYLGEDERGLKALTCVLHCTLHTYELYEEKGIPRKVFAATFGFIPRFLEWYKSAYGVYGFDRTWWIPRELALKEFRIGELEYEMVEEEGKRQVSIHIPSDAVLEKQPLNVSYEEAKTFLKTYYPAYENAEFVCDSWLLASGLKECLDAGSRILYFQSCFEVLHEKKDVKEFMEWIYFRTDLPYGELPENTSLQRRVKQYLLAGGKIGWAFGRLKGF